MFTFDFGPADSESSTTLVVSTVDKEHFNLHLSDDLSLKDKPFQLEQVTASDVESFLTEPQTFKIPEQALNHWLDHVPPETIYPVTIRPNLPPAVDDVLGELPMFDPLMGQPNHHKPLHISLYRRIVHGLLPGPTYQTMRRNRRRSP